MTNLALAAQRQRNFSECFRWCDKALRWAPAASPEQAPSPHAWESCTAQRHCVKVDQQCSDS